MSRKTDLEQHMARSFDIIGQCEEIISLSDRPKEIARNERTIAEQRKLIERYLPEYRRLVGDALPPAVNEIAVYLEQAAESEGARADDQPPSQREGTVYNVHIQHATGLAIGDNAQVNSPSGDDE